MKTLLALIVTAFSLQAQTTVNLGSLTVPNNIAACVETIRLSMGAPGNYTLASNIGAAATTIPLNTTGGLPSTGQIVIDNEAITYSGISGNSLTGATRGSTITTASAHAAGAVVRRLQYPSAAAAVRAKGTEFWREQIKVEGACAALASYDTAISTARASKDADTESIQ